MDSKPITSYKDVLRFYSSNCESYISCFTTLFESDFDIEGNIKASTVERLKKLDSNNTKDIPRPPRSAVIFPCDVMMSYFSAVDYALLFLRGVKNGELEVFDKGKRFFNILKNSNSFYKFFKIKQSDGKLLLINPSPKTYAVLEKGLFGFDIQTFKASYVHYADPECIRTLTDDVKDDLSKNNDKKNFSEKYEKYLAYCLLEKKKVDFFKGHNYRYDDQHEFRLMFTFFEDKKSKELPNGLKLNFKLCPQYSKIITNENLGNIKRAFFNTADYLDKVSLN